MRTQLNRIIATALAAAAIAGTGVACSSDKADAATNSAYCKIARKWAVHELDPRDDQNPAWFKPYWAEYLTFTSSAAKVAPKAIHDDWVTYRQTIAAQTALLEKYGYDQARGEREATDEEKKAYEDPGPDANSAFHNVLTYEALTCDAAQPLPADVDFSKQKPGAYCDVVAADNERNAGVMEAGAPADQIKATALDPQTAKASAAMVRTAPSVIRDDVRPIVDWWKHEQLSVLKKFNFDFRRILLEGSPQDRRDLQLTDKRVRDHFARTVAYEEQVCGE